MSSIKRNFALNLINTISGLLFPLVTFPYASRILLADGIGQVQFFQGIIGYISLCTSLGIPLYAIREIARVRDDKIQCGRTAVEILLLHSLLTLAGYIIVFVLITTVAKVQADIPLFLLLSTNLFFTAIGALWFYQGIEDFKYITIRTLIVRTFSLLALFLFVKDKSDLFYYAAISVVAEAGGNVFNFIRLRKFLAYRYLNVHTLHPMRHFKPALKIFLLSMVISIYVGLDTVMLGFLKNEVAVGYYAAATRITKSILGVVQSLGTVLLPRFSNLVSTNQMVDFKNLSDKAISLVLATSLPLTVGLIFMASPLIHLFCGENFEPSILTLQIMSPIILFIAMSGIIGMQILYSLGKEKLVILATLGGAIMNFSLNWALIPSYGQYGAGIATSIAEFVVTTLMIVLGWKYMPVRFFSRQNCTYYIATFAMTVFLLFLLLPDFGEVTYCFIGVVLSIILYITILSKRKDPLVCQFHTILNRKIHRNA